MRSSLRVRLFAAFVGVVLVNGALTVLAGSVLIRRMVVAEAQRRVDLALSTADDMLRARLARTRQSASDVAAAVAASMSSDAVVDRADLERRRAETRQDVLHVIGPDGRVVAAAGSYSIGEAAPESPVLGRALKGESTAGLSLLPLSALGEDNPTIRQRADIAILPTARAKPGGPRELEHAMALEGAAPIVDQSGVIRGAVRLATVLNGNFEFVDAVQGHVFTGATYGTKNLGTVTIFQDDVRIATNVLGPDGERAVGTRVSAEVYDRVLTRGDLWTGPAFVVDSWYISAYEPLYDLDGSIIGMLYVGVLKDRYDDMRTQAVRVFVGIGLLALVLAGFLAIWFAARLTRPLAGLTAGVEEVARGNLDYKLTPSDRGSEDEIGKLATAFGQMVAALRERDDQLRASNVELQQWVQNYLDILGFITHELKNQIAAMTINLYAVRDGYVGQISDEQREALDDVAATIDHSQEMILNYLNLSRIERGEVQVRAQPLHVEDDVVRPVLASVRRALEDRGMELEIDIPPELTVRADPSLLRIVYTNLIANAVKYGREGGRVRLSARRGADMAELHVWNEGQGVPADKMGQLFRKFSRLHSSADDEPGTGLGLFITREIVRRHGGEIRAESSYGESIDFVFSLPLA